MAEVEVIPARARRRKGGREVIPDRPLNLRPGDRSEIVRFYNGRTHVVVYRASWWTKLKLRLGGKA